MYKVTNGLFTIRMGHRILMVALMWPILLQGCGTDMVTKPASMAKSEKQAHALMTESPELSHALIRSAGTGIYIVQEGRFVYVNSLFQELTGYTEADLIGTYCLDHVHPDDRKTVRKKAIESLKEQSLLPYEYRFISKNGSIIWVLEKVTSAEYGGKPATIGSFMDTSELKQAGDALMELQEGYKALVDAAGKAGEGILMFQDIENRESSIIFANDEIAHITGYSREELLNKSALDLLAPDVHTMMQHQSRKRRAGEEVSSYYEIALIRKDGTMVPVEVGVGTMIHREKNATVVYLRDITERKQAEDTIKRRLQFEETVARVSSRFVGSSDIDSAINASLADIGILSEASRAYVFLFCEGGTKMSNTHEWCAEGVSSQMANLQNFPCDLFPSWMKKLRRGEVIHIKDVSKMPEEAIVEMEILEGQDIKSVLILPLNTGVELVGFIGFDNVAATDGWNGEDLALLRIASETLGNTIARQQSRDELEQSLLGLQKVVKGTIAAMSIIVESRDPYTAGHQRRVTNLACAIAEDMGLPSGKIDGIRMAASIHDIGKTCVPGEILSKPGQLRESEFSLIQNHPEVGYDILKEVEFPCQVARIVLQHHERLDGSGYPAGLSGEGILLEARILGVADVVEAMASHRPYRPALGIGESLREISQNAGILYDPEVVNACVRLFTEKGFKFE